jgi:Tfp pilus assembly protein PilF
MFSSRNIHFAILGLILGASAGYVFAFVRADKTSGIEAAASQSAVPPGHPAVSPGHPAVSDAQMLEALKQAVEADPAQPELIVRYGAALFDTGRFSEAEQWLAKAVQLDPKDIYARSMHGAVLWQLGRKEEAQTELQAGLRQDPQHIPSLHGLLLLAIEKKDRARSTELLERIEKTEPGYGALPALKLRFREEFGTGK